MFTVLAKDRQKTEDEAQDLEGDLTSVTAQDPLREDPLSEYEGIYWIEKCIMHGIISYRI